MKLHSPIFVVALALLVSSANGETFGETIANTNAIPPYTFRGCYRYKDEKTGTVTLDDSRSFAKDGEAMTVEACVSQCAERNFFYAGIRNGEECSCGNEFDTYGVAYDCNIPCPSVRGLDNPSVPAFDNRQLQGESPPTCGGTDSNSVYSVSQSIFKLADEVEEPEVIHFQGDGCVEYDFSEGGWTALPFVDDINVFVPMGISFTYNGATYTDIYINSNGHLHFGNGGSDGFAPPPDMTTYAYNAIAPFWADINIARAGQILYKTVGNKFVVVWQEVAAYGKGTIKPNTFQVVLTDDDPTLTGEKICFCYCQMEWARCCTSDCGKVGLSTTVANQGFFLASFNLTDTTWNGIGTEGNGVEHLHGRSYCFDQDIVTASNPESEITETHNPGGCVQGDPHFKTWQNEHYEYHGQCDLVLAKDPEFADGLGLDVHIRTKLVRHWSFIKAAVIRIGNDILEIEGAITNVDKVHYWSNYEYQGDLTEFGGFPVTIEAGGNADVLLGRIEIDLSSKYPGQKITLSTFKEFVKVDFSDPSAKAFGNTVGMLGDFDTGKTLARDGATVLNDFTDLGREWQVLPSDGFLFHETSFPQFPELCIEPENPRGERRRRLVESNITLEQAEKACGTLKDKLDRKDCVYDILATQDMDMVGAF